MNNPENQLLSWHSQASYYFEDMYGVYCLVTNDNTWRNKYADGGDEEEEESEEHGDGRGGEKNNIQVRESSVNDPSSNISQRVAHLPQDPSRTIIYYLMTNTWVWTWSLRLLVSNRPQRYTVA